MAIGDCFAIFMGTAITNRQPASGVAESIGCIGHDAGSDQIVIYNGSVTVMIVESDVATHRGRDAARPSGMAAYSIAVLIDNTNYIRKTGTSDRYAVNGVQVDT